MVVEGEPRVSGQQAPARAVIEPDPDYSSVRHHTVDDPSSFVFAPALDADVMTIRELFPDEVISGRRVGPVLHGNDRGADLRGIGTPSPEAFDVFFRRGRLWRPVSATS